MGLASKEPHLTVVDSGAALASVKKPKKELTPGSKAWAESKRDEARALVASIDMQYIHLGRHLWDLFDVPVDGNPGGKPSFSFFGHAKFDDFCAAELGLHYRKAYTFRSIYYRLYVELKELDATLRERIVALGWTKVRGITRVLTLANAVSWIEYAEKHTSTDIEKKVGAQLEEARKKKAVEEGLGFEAAAAGAGFGEAGEAPAPVSKKSKKGAVATPDPTSGAGDDLLPSADELFQTDKDAGSEPIFDPSIADIDPRKKRFFFLLDEENELVSAAIELSAKLSGQEHQAANLALICLEFTATNTAAARPNIQQDFKMNLLAQVEKLLGVELIAVDAKTQQAIYASAAMKQKAAAE